MKKKTIIDCLIEIIATLTIVKEISAKLDKPELGPMPEFSSPHKPDPYFDPCSKLCQNTECPDWKTDDTCGASQVCKCQVPIIDQDGRCTYCGAGDEYSHSFSCPTNMHPDKKIQGYTHDEWEQIRAGGYICEFWEDGMSFKVMHQLKEIVTDSSGRFLSMESESYWRNCRPAQIKGVLRPWFGGECPVDPDAKVFIRLRDGSTGIQCAGTLMWDGPKAIPSSAIIAFMEI